MTSTTKTRRPIFKPTIDVKTKNISFLQTSQDLKTLGIKNNKFFLAIYDRSLIGVDPFDIKNLTKDKIQRIITECIINPWYFKREIARIPDAGGSPVPFELNRGNLAASFCFHNHIDHYFVIPRQTGKTQSEISDILWAFLFGTNDSEFSFSNIRAEDAVRNLGRLKDQRDLLPPYLRFKVAINEDGKLDSGVNNIKSISCPATGNSIVVKPSATSVEAADTIGRGTTQTITMHDEVDFCKYVDTIVKAMGPAFGTASRSAKKNNAAYCRVFMSTPGDIDSLAGRCALNIINDTAPWSERFYDHLDEVQEYLDVNSKNGIMYIEYSYQALGKDEEWFRYVCKLLSYDPLKIKREVFLKRMRGSELSPYEAAHLDEIQDNMKEKIDEIFINKYFKVDVYEELNPNIGYIVGCDVATGVNGDNNAVTILNPHTCKPVAEFRSPHMTTPQYRDFLRMLLIRHIPRSILCIERNNTGIALIQMLLETDVASRLYFDMTAVHEVGTTLKNDKDGWLVAQSQNQKAYGVWTGKNSRDAMFKLLETHIVEKRDSFVCKMLIDDIFGLVRNKRGKIEAGAGGHDDNVMSYLIALYVYYYGKNLSQFGISKTILNFDDEAELQEKNQIEDAYELLREQGYDFGEAPPDDIFYEDVVEKERRHMLEQARKALNSDPSSGVNVRDLDSYNDFLQDDGVEDDIDSAIDSFYGK